MIKTKLAVGVGYEFVIVSGNLVQDVTLQNTNQLVSVSGVVYPLYKGLEYADSKKIDAIMDGPNHPQIYKINSHIVE